MEPLHLPTEPRTTKGKNAARQLRMQGRLPAVFYGAGLPPVSLAIEPKALLKAVSTPHKRNQLLELEIAGKKQLAMVKEIQIHPVTRSIEHVDLCQVELSREITVHVPFTSEGRAKGVVEGGEIYVHYRTLPLRCTPDKVPVQITIDVTNVGMGESLPAKDVPLPAGVTMLLDAELSVVSCAEPRKMKEEEPDAAAVAAAAAAAAAPGAAAPGTTPAAGGAAPAAGGAAPAASGDKKG